MSGKRKPGTGIPAGRSFVCRYCERLVEPTDTIARHSCAPKVWFHANCLDEMVATANAGDIPRLAPPERKSRT